MEVSEGIVETYAKKQDEICIFLCLIVAKAWLIERDLVYQKQCRKGWPCAGRV
jgi:hypothetical protein